MNVSTARQYRPLPHIKHSFCSKHANPTRSQNYSLTGDHITIMTICTYHFPAIHAVVRSYLSAVTIVTMAVNHSQAWTCIGPGARLVHLANSSGGWDESIESARTTASGVVAFWQGYVRFVTLDVLSTVYVVGGAYLRTIASRHVILTVLIFLRRRSTFVVIITSPKASHRCTPLELSFINLLSFITGLKSNSISSVIFTPSFLGHKFFVQFPVRDAINISK